MTFLPELSCHLRRRRGASDAGRAGRGDRESCVTESGWEAAELQGRGSGLRCEQSLSPGAAQPQPPIFSWVSEHWKYLLQLLADTDTGAEDTQQ